MLRRVALLVMVLGATFTSDLSTTSAAQQIEQAWTRVTPVRTFVGQPGRTYVAATGGVEEARAFVQLRGPVDERVVRIRLTEADDSLRGTTPSVVACLLTGSLSRSGELTSAEAPKSDCRTQARLTHHGGGTWVIDLGVFVEPWRSASSRGLVLIPEVASDTAGTFRLAFDASATQTVAIVGGPSSEATGGAAGSKVPVSELPSDRPPSDWAVPEIDFAEPSFPVARSEVPDADAPATAGPESVTRADAMNAVRSSSNGPSAVVFFVLLGVLSVLVIMRPRVRQRLVVPRVVRKGDGGSSALGYGAFAVLALLPLLGSQLTVFRSGLVVIFIVAAIGLHLLVNWAGELSLAHAAMVGLPAFVVAGLSEVGGVSPIYLLPFGVASGAAVGLIVALPALRSHGLQVALVTLVAGKAIERYFYSQEWLSPRGGRVAADAEFAFLAVSTPRALYPILLVVASAAAAVAWALLHSKLARAWFWVRADPAAAAAFGIPVARYRLLAYAVGGSFAGLAGGLTVMWVQRLSPSAFPTTLSVTYLVVAVLAGPGYVGGTALAGGALEAGRLFGSGTGALIAYAGPIALVLTVTRYKAGLNGIGRNLMRRLLARSEDPDSGLPVRSSALTGPTDRTDPIYPGFIVGVVAILGGFLAIGLAWYHAGNTNQVWIQNQELISGGFGGVALVLTGSGLLVRDRLIHAQRALAQLNSPRTDAAPGPEASPSPATLRALTRR